MPTAAHHPFIIYRPAPGAGFFSNFFFVLDHLEQAERQNLCPVVDMQNHPTHYCEAEPINGGCNGWEYYFEQPGGLALADAQDARSNAGQRIPKGFLGLAGRPPSARMLTQGRALVRRYIRVKASVQALVDILLPPGCHTDTLGVHVRGGDMRAGAPGHPVPPAATAYLRQAQRLDAKQSFARIALACDEIETIALFQDAFGSRLITGQSQRQTAAHPQAADFTRLFDGQRPQHRYQMGLEVLCDALLLSRCGTLLAGHSNVSLAARCFADSAQRFVEVPPVGLCGKNGQLHARWRFWKYRLGF